MKKGVQSLITHIDKKIVQTFYIYFPLFATCVGGGRKRNIIEKER